MSRPVYTVLYSLFIITVFFTSAAIYQSCGKSKNKEILPENLSEKVENVADTYTDETFFEEDEESPNETEEEPSDSYASDQTSPETNNSSFTPQEATSPRVSEGMYMVIAGNYLLENNADIMVNRLRSNGYNKSEKVVFDLSQYYTVLAGAYNSQSVASSISSELTAKGIDNYILRRK